MKPNPIKLCIDFFLAKRGCDLEGVDFEMDMLRKKCTPLNEDEENIEDVLLEHFFLYVEGCAKLIDEHNRNKDFPL